MLVTRVICFLVIISVVSSSLRHKRDTASLIDYALNLFYTGQTYTLPAIKLDVTNNGYCGYTYRYNSYYLRDIIGQDSSVTSLESCIRGCMNLQTCVAVNYIQSLSQCVALTNFGPTLDDVFKPVDGSLHAYFTNCPSKIPKSSTNLPPAGAAPSGCGKPYFQQNTIKFIIGGTTAVPYSFPWIAWLTSENGPGLLATCGATLINSGSSTSSDIAITAAHCVQRDDGVMRTNFKLYFGNQDNRFKESREIIVGAKAVVVHPQYSRGTITNDIAIIKLATPVIFNNFISPVCMPDANSLPKDPNKCMGAGWGRVSDSNNETAFMLQQLKMPTIVDSTCAKQWGRNFNSSIMICAGNNDGQSATCQGDSGGPLVCFENDHWTLYGATSFGLAGKCASITNPSVFARVSGFRTWIDQQIAALRRQ